MRLLAVSDLHGDLAAVARAVERHAPDALLCCGDWGDPGEIDADALASLAARLPIATTFGNHDDVALLRSTRNADGSPLLIEQGELRTFAGLRVAAIGGIWAKSHRKPYYVTDDDVARLASEVAGQGPVDVLLTHACPVGLADMTPSGRHGGQRCFLQASRQIAPRLHLCGHVHVAQERVLGDGRRVVNVGATPEGSVVVVDVGPGEFSARLDRA